MTDPPNEQDNESEVKQKPEQECPRTEHVTCVLNPQPGVDVPDFRVVASPRRRNVKADDSHEGVSSTVCITAIHSLNPREVS